MAHRRASMSGHDILVFLSSTRPYILTSLFFSVNMTLPNRGRVSTAVRIFFLWLRTRTSFWSYAARLHSGKATMEATFVSRAYIPLPRSSSPTLYNLICLHGDMNLSNPISGIHVRGSKNHLKISRWLFYETGFALLMILLMKGMSVQAE